MSRPAAKSNGIAAISPGRQTAPSPPYNSSWQPPEPILIPKLRIEFADFPDLH